jgi:hypothetical protein
MEMEIFCPQCLGSRISANRLVCTACGFEAGFDGRILNLKRVPHMARRRLLR